MLCRMPALLPAGPFLHSRWRHSMCPATGRGREAEWVKLWAQEGRCRLGPLPACPAWSRHSVSPLCDVSCGCCHRLPQIDSLTALEMSSLRSRWQQGCPPGGPRGQYVSVRLPCPLAVSPFLHPQNQQYSVVQSLSDPVLFHYISCLTLTVLFLSKISE